ncbi:hypothetical protein HYV86_01970 [Candidatus Woesearchaeota archaeon]|nr:hypothetical protein [Candidatus Woesearchaeota archaeon]
MLKRGQVTIFIIVGIVLLVLIATVYFLTSSSVKQEVGAGDGEIALSSKVASPIVPFIEKCLRDVATPGVYLAGVQGGVIYSEGLNHLLTTEKEFVNYGYLGGERYITLDLFEEQLNRYVEEELPLCLNDFAVFEKQKIHVEPQSELQVSTSLQADVVLVTLDYELRVELGEEQLDLDTFEVRLPLRVSRVMDEMERLIAQVEKNAAQIYSASSSDFFISTLPYDGTTFVYSIVDDKSVIDGAPFTLMFAVDMPPINTAPVLSPVADIVVRAGSKVVYSLTVEDREENVMEFSSSNPLVTVDNEGVVRFSGSGLGDISSTIAVRDSQGLEDSVTITFHVIE